MAKGSVREDVIIQTTHHYLWKKQNPWLSNRRSVCQLPILFTAENYPAAKVISKGNPRDSSAQQGRFWEQFLYEQFLYGWICRQYINEEASHRPTQVPQNPTKENAMFSEQLMCRHWRDAPPGASGPGEPSFPEDSVETLIKPDSRRIGGKAAYPWNGRAGKAMMWETGNTNKRGNEKGRLLRVSSTS